MDWYSLQEPSRRSGQTDHVKLGLLPIRITQESIPIGLWDRELVVQLGLEICKGNAPHFVTYPEEPYRLSPAISCSAVVWNFPRECSTFPTAALYNQATPLEVRKSASEGH